VHLFCTDTLLNSHTTAQHACGTRPDTMNTTEGNCKWKCIPNRLHIEPDTLHISQHSGTHITTLRLRFVIMLTPGHFSAGLINTQHYKCPVHGWLLWHMVFLTYEFWLCHLLASVNWTHIKDGTERNGVSLQNHWVTGILELPAPHFHSKWPQHLNRQLGVLLLAANII
jgi:hypothetical protein